MTATATTTRPALGAELLPLLYLRRQAAEYGWTLASIVRERENGYVAATWHRSERFDGGKIKYTVDPIGARLYVDTPEGTIPNAIELFRPIEILRAYFGWPKPEPVPTSGVDVAVLPSATSAPENPVPLTITPARLKLLDAADDGELVWYPGFGDRIERDAFTAWNGRGLGRTITAAVTEMWQANWIRLGERIHAGSNPPRRWVVTDTGQAVRASAEAAT